MFEDRVEVGARDAPRFDELFTAHAARLVRLAALLGAEDPEDVVQESFCKLYGARARVERADPVAYLNRIVVNEVRSRGRRQRTAAVKRHLLQDDGVTVHVTAERRAVVEEMHRLPPRQREALVLRFWLDLPFEQVAAAMGVRQGTAKSQVSRGLATLARALGDDPTGIEEDR